MSGFPTPHHPARGQRTRLHPSRTAGPAPRPAILRLLLVLFLATASRAPTLPATPSLSGEIFLLRLKSEAVVYSHPPRPTVFTIPFPALVTRIFTYHWNGGQGRRPGAIGLKHVRTGKTLGTWHAMGIHGDFFTDPGSTWPTEPSGPPFRYWLVWPKIRLDPGTYEVTDSDPLTWSTNAELQHMGCAWVYGIPLGDVSQRPAPTPTDRALASRP